MKVYRNTDKEMILRDELALDRTRLANERTYLAYVRTAIGIGAAGLGLLKLFSELAVVWLGYISIGAGVLVLALGTLRFLRMRGQLRALMQNTPDLRD